MLENNVVMAFKDALGKKVTLNIKDAKKDVTDEDISAAMDAIIANSFIVGTNGPLTEKLEAELIVKDTTKVIL